MNKRILKALTLTAALCLCLPILSACGNNSGKDDTQSIVSTAQGADAASVTPQSGVAHETLTSAVNDATNTADGKTSAGAETQTGELKDYGSYYVYYPNQDRSGLLREEIGYSKDYAEDLAGRVRESLSELMRKSDADYAPLASDDRNIKSISLDPQGALLIDFEQGFFDDVSEMDMPDNAAVYGLINTLAQYSQIRSVRFTVEGKPLIWDEKEIDEPIEENTEIVQER